jgi:hypothetical protein
MEAFPEIPELADAPEVVEQGHCWVTELVDGDPIRFRLGGDGRLEFGDRRRTFGTNPPPEYGYAADHVRETLDREALTAAVEDPGDYTFFAVGTRRRAIDYDWDRIPPVLGTDVYDGHEERFRPPDAVHGIFERLGLAPVNPLDREVTARDFDPECYATTDSAWYDGPANGVVIHNKAGGRAKRYHPAFGSSGPGGGNDPGTGSGPGGRNESGHGGVGDPGGEDDPTANRAGEYDDAAELAREFATADRIDEALETHDAADAVDRVFAVVVRAAHPHVFGRGGVDVDELRSAVASRVYRRVGNG